MFSLTIYHPHTGQLVIDQNIVLFTEVITIGNYYLNVMKFYGLPEQKWNEIRNGSKEFSSIKLVDLSLPLKTILKFEPRLEDRSFENSDPGSHRDSCPKDPGSHRDSCPKDPGSHRDSCPKDPRVIVSSNVDIGAKLFKIHSALIGAMKDIKDIESVCTISSSEILKVTGQIEQVCLELADPSRVGLDRSISPVPLFIEYLRVTRLSLIHHHLISVDLEYPYLRVNETHVFEAYENWCNQKKISPGREYRSKIIKLLAPNRACGTLIVLDIIY